MWPTPMPDILKINQMSLEDALTALHDSLDALDQLTDPTAKGIHFHHAQVQLAQIQLRVDTPILQRKKYLKLKQRFEKMEQAFVKEFQLLQLRDYISQLKDKINHNSRKDGDWLYNQAHAIVSTYLPQTNVPNTNNLD